MNVTLNWIIAAINVKVAPLLAVLNYIVIDEFINIYHINFLIVNGKWKDGNGRKIDSRFHRATLPRIVLNLYLVIFDCPVDYIDPLLSH